MYLSYYQSKSKPSSGMVYRGGHFISATVSRMITIHCKLRVFLKYNRLMLRQMLMRCLKTPTIWLVIWPTRTLLNNKIILGMKSAICRPYYAHHISQVLKYLISVLWNVIKKCLRCR